ncbi:MAG: hypothetical protein ACR2NM_14155 [Bythopirellula sp.]
MSARQPDRAVCILQWVCFAAAGGATTLYFHALVTAAQLLVELQQGQ